MTIIMKKNQSKDVSWRRRYDGKYRKPIRARNVVLIALMTAFCVVANLICSHTIPLHAGTTIVLLSGISLGPETGFLVGVLSRLLCNFFDGQGAWTIWQMFTWGLLGVIAGLIFYQRSPGSRRRELSEIGEKSGNRYRETLETGEKPGNRHRETSEAEKKFRTQKTWRSNIWILTVFTFVVVFVVYGGVMNLAAMFMNYTMSPQDYPMNRGNLIAIYMTGIPYDLTHAAGAAICMFLFGEAFLRRIRRIQIKYGV